MPKSATVPARFKAVPLEDWPDDVRREYLEGQPKRLRDYIAYLEGEIEELEGDLHTVEEAVSFDEALAQTWHAVGARRLGSGDQAGAWRAFRAAENARCA